MKKSLVKPLTGKRVLELLKKSKVYMSQPPAFVKAKNPHILNIIAIIGEDQLNSNATFANIIKANLHFSQYCLDHGLAEEIAKEAVKSKKQMSKKAKRLKTGIAQATGDFGELFSAFFSDDLVGSLTQTVSSLQDSLAETLKEYSVALSDPKAFLKNNGMTVLQGLIWLGLTPDVAARCANGSMTIIELLSVDPSVFVNLPGTNS